MGELVSTHCKGKTTFNEFLNSGVYLMTVPQQCALSDKNWVVEPVRNSITRVSIAATRIVYNSIDFEVVLNKTRVLKLMNTPHLDSMEYIKYVELKPLKNVNISHEITYTSNDI